MRDIIEEELARSQTIISGGAEIVPRFRIFTADGEVTIFVQLPQSIEKRMRRFGLVQSYMAVHMATSFVMATELYDPDASSAIAVSRRRSEAGVQMINRKPLKFYETHWLDASEIGDEITSMLPRKIDAVTAEQVAEVDHLIKHSEGLRLEAR